MRSFDVFLRSNTHKEFERCKHIEIFIENPNINVIDRIFYSCLIKYFRKHDYYLIKSQLKLNYNDYQFCPYVTSKLSDNKTMISWSNFLNQVNSDFKEKGCNFNQISEMNIITIANNLDMSYDFYIKHNMHAVEWKSYALINKNKSLIKKLIRNWRHHLTRKYENYRV